MGKRGRVKSRSKKNGPFEGTMSSPQPNAEKITRYFAASPTLLNAAEDQATSSAKTPNGDISGATQNAVPSGILTPESTPTKPSSAAPPEDPSPDCTLPYPLEAEGDADTSAPRALSHRLANGHTEENVSDIRHVRHSMSIMNDMPHTPKSAVARSLQGQLGRAASTKKNRRRGKKSGKAGSKTSQVQSPSVQKPKESITKPITDFFPVRRSDRRCKSRLEADKKIELEDAILSNREEGLEVQKIVGKGRGVVSTKLFRRGDFVVEYAGDLISIPEANEREVNYKKDSSVGCYMYYFEHRNKKYCIDATAESGRLGRLLNHSSKLGNCCTKLVDIGERPYLILVAKRDIEIGEELLYDYGDRNKETLEAHPWLAL